MTETVYIKHPFTDKELLEVARKMSRAESTIREKEDELKSVATTIKAEIAEQDAIIHGCAEKLNSGYEMQKVECSLKYENGKAIYIDRNGVIVEERDMTESEQMHLVSGGKFTDAEDIIRADNKKEDDNGHNG